MKNQIFAILQRVGRSFMLPVAILPIAGFFLGLGSSLTNPTTIATYNLSAILGPGTLLNAFLTILMQAGNALFNNLPIIFAVGIAIGMAKREKEVAALSAVIAYFVMNASINSMLTISGQIRADGTLSPDILKGMVTTSVGIQTLQMGVFGGIIVGLGVSALHNRFHRIKFPNALAFFGGSRFVPIISTVVYVFVGIVMFYLWPTVQERIFALGTLVAGTGYAGTFIFGMIERALVPFGLHHVFYLPFWQTGVGGSMTVAGHLVEGGQNIFFAQLADGATTHFSADACRYFTGKFVTMIFGLPGAALAMYHCAKPEKKKVAGGLLFSAALTSMLTGITEPLEFSFLFVAPILFVVEVVLAGAAFMIVHMLNIAVGLTFSGGLLDFFFFGILQGNDKTDWIRMIPVGIVYFFLYYFVFKFLIEKFDLKTPGREENQQETRLYTRKDYHRHKSDKQEFEFIALLVRGLGGVNNILDLDCCATRLRCTLDNVDLVDELILKQTGSRGIMKGGDSIQIIFGPSVTIIKSNLETYLAEQGQIPFNYVEDFVEPLVDKIYAPLPGKRLPLQEVPDAIFSEGMLGEGFAIDPLAGEVYAPVNGRISAIFDTKHALVFESDLGAEILVHIGIDTVQLGGKYFHLLVETGQQVEAGNLVATFDLDAIKAEGYSAITPIVINNSNIYNEIQIELEKEEVLTLIK